LKDEKREKSATLRIEKRRKVDAGKPREMSRPGCARPLPGKFVTLRCNLAGAHASPFT